jgi:hypothetical protein
VLDRLHIYAGLLLIVAFATTFATAANAANAAPFEIDVILSTNRHRK